MYMSREFVSYMNISVETRKPVDTQFSFKDDGNNTNAIMRSTSFFLKEDGGAGTVSHVDMMI